MNAVVLSNTYFPNIAHCIAIVHAKEIVLEQWDSYQKQTLRNRANILGANGTLSLTIPVNYSQKNRQYFKDVEVNSAENWQSQHLKSLYSAYSTSPYFEFYIDELTPLFKERVTHLYEFNLSCLKAILNCFDIQKDLKLTKEFDKEIPSDSDFRYLAKKNIFPYFEHDKYLQVFSSKFDFTRNLSCLDLLFNEGPNAVNYLKQQSLSSIIQQ
ncbi:MAG: WbqC family protein [bacterium]